MGRIKGIAHSGPIGHRVRAARLQAGLSQRQLSERLELIPVYLCRCSISRIENNKRALGQAEIKGIAKALHVSLESLLGEEP